MRITPEILRKIARDTVAQRTRSDRDILAVYLQGSLLSDNPLIGGTTDIDLFFIHNGETDKTREIVKLTDEVHLDIAHHARYLYHQTRNLRVHPWMGPNIYHCKILYDPQHFMDFTLASVSGQFDLPENIMARSRLPVEQARQSWLSFQLEQPQASPPVLSLYLTAVERAANSLAGLYGPPLPERRLLLEFPERANSAGQPGLHRGLIGLLGGGNADPQILKSWIPDWRKAIEALAGKATPAELHPHRIPYYQRSFEAMLAGTEPLAMLWPLLRTWNSAIQILNERSPHHKTWEAAMHHLGLYGDAFSDRLSGLDAYLDMIEECLENWGRLHGVE
jgi:hypothetical protein